jgi:uncharacterized protein
MAGDINWDESKRRSNWLKHGLDFAQASSVLDSPYRLDVDQIRKGEWRTQSFAYVFDMLAVLTVVHVSRGETVRIISFRRASTEERVAYHDWLQSE